MRLTPLAAALALVLAAGAAAQNGPPAAPPAPTPPSLVSCNIAVAMFAPRSDVIDAGSIRQLDRISGLIAPTLKDDGVSVIVLPHPVVLEPANDAEQRAIAARRGEKIRQYLAAHGVPANRIGIRPADTDPRVEDNWGDGALLMLEITQEAWARQNFNDIC